MPLAIMTAATEDPYPLALSDANTQTNNKFSLRYKKTTLLASGFSIVKATIASNDPTQLIVQDGLKLMRVAPVVGFCRTGKMDTPLNVLLGGYQWSYASNQWLQMNLWREQIPANVSSYTIAFAPTYRFACGYWTFFETVLEHASSGEGVYIDQWSTFVEFTACT